MTNHSAGLAITTQPQKPIVEKSAFGQELNLDFLLSNSTSESLTVTRIGLRALDSGERPEYARTIDTSGFSPALLTIPNRTVGPGETLLIFNPFHCLPGNLSLSLLEYDFELTTGDNAHQKFGATVKVQPLHFKPQTRLIVPVNGLVLVTSGHDFLAHHRRFDYLVAERIGFSRSNFMRGSWDMFVVDKNGSRCRPDCASMSDYFGYRAPVLAPAEGRVVVADGSFPDDFGGQNLSPANVQQNLRLFHGNFIVIEHAPKEYTLLAHLRPESLSVEAGDLVKPGQQIAEIGCSGSAEEPHLHWEFRDGPDFNAEGLPGRFREFVRVLGDRMITERDGVINSGDFVRGNPAGLAES